VPVRATAGIVVLSVLVAAGCGGRAGHALRSERSTQVAHSAGVGRVATPVALRSCRVGTQKIGSLRLAYGAAARRPLAVHALPRAGKVVRRFGRLDLNGFPVVFGVTAERRGASCAAQWYRVQLPTLPNGSRGWVRAADVRLFTVRSRIVVDLGARTLALYRNGRSVLRARVAVGAPSTPTPVGRYYVNERFLLSSPNGPFGVAALGISAHSDVLRDWVQNGPIALHGTDEPALIGEAASHGCVRLSNSAMKRLFRLAPAGTPVVIRS